MVPLSLKRARREPKAPETFVATPAPPPAELHAIARKMKRKSPDKLPSDLLNGEAAASAPELRAAPAPAPRADARGPKRAREPDAPKAKESDVAKRASKNLPDRRPELAAFVSVRLFYMTLLLRRGVVDDELVRRKRVDGHHGGVGERLGLLRDPCPRLRARLEPGDDDVASHQIPHGYWYAGERRLEER